MLFGIAVIAGVLSISAAVSQPAHAISFNMQPLLYKDHLAKGEKKKGFVDISNPTGQTMQFTTSVQAFRQVNDEGGLSFYDDARIRAGLIPDLRDFELGPHEALRLYFLLDGTKLPSGDVMAALFATVSTNTGGVAQNIRIGTLFTLVNGTPGPREAVVTRLTVPFIQIGESVQGSYTIHNTADPSRATGFYPASQVALQPFGPKKTIESPFTYAGRSRLATFSLPTNRIGIYKLSVTYRDSTQSHWVFLVTGYWRWLAPMMVILGIALLVLLKRHRGAGPRRRARKS
jgi:hypothetical protein